MEIVRCKRCNHVLRSTESIKRGYGRTCYRIFKLQEANKPEQPNNSILEELLNRVKKLELDNNFMKHQLKHKTFSSKSKDSELDWDIPKEVKEVKKVYEVKFNVIIKELKIIFTDDFNYHDILKPINPIEEIVNPPVLIPVLA